ncbi:MAG: helix-turn-helix domain-containing protein [Armatimonadetes bacterium]|nr:helix-turn-helix domain-containing protein [Armatimonadota bacterium]
MNGIIISIDRSELQELIQQTVAETVAAEFDKQKSEKPKLQQRESPRYYTRKETATKLRVTLPTLWRWENEGVLVPKKIGRRVLYERSMVENLQSQSTRGRR